MACAQNFAKKESRSPRGFLPRPLLRPGETAFRTPPPLPPKNRGGGRSQVTLKMAWGLIVLWVGAGGYIMHRFRDSIKNFVQRIPLGWKKKFVLFATLLFLIKEAIITTITNLAPVFGASIGEVYITAPANFLDVVFFHSATMFVGPFVFWALALRRYDFSPFGAFIVFGLTGLLGEIGFSAHSRCRSLPCGCLYMAL